jgi:hypothetical protein
MLNCDKEIVRHPYSGESHREGNRGGHKLYKDSLLSSPDIFAKLG